MSLAWLSYFISEMRGGCSEYVHDFIEAAELASCRTGSRLSTSWFRNLQLRALPQDFPRKEFPVLFPYSHGHSRQFQDR